MNEFLRNILVGGAVAAALMAGGEAFGAERADTLRLSSLPAGSIELSEVSVTAIKGGNSANADEAVTNISRSTVDTYDLVSLKQAADLAPNFFVPSYGSRMTSSIYVRGLGTRIDQPAVGLNIDNIPLINKDNFDFDIADIDRIEILRGPQNILYGRNTMGGLVNIYTLSPLNFQGVTAKASFGMHDTYRLSAGVYRTMSKVLGMSLSGQMEGTNGFYRNEFNDAPVGRERSGSIRWKTAYRPKSNVVVENTAIFSRATQRGYPYMNIAEDRIAYNDTCYYKRLSFIDGLTVKHSFKGITFSSIMSFQYLDDDLTLDQDFTTEDYFTLQQKRKEWAVTADFVARGPQTGVYSWLGGFFGFVRRSKMDAPVTFLPTGIDRLVLAHRNEYNPYYPAAWDTPDFLLGSSFTLPSGGLSLYHESSVTLGNFTATIGLRFDWERTDMRYRSFCDTDYTVYDNYGLDSSVPVTELPVYRKGHILIDVSDKYSNDYTQLLPKFSVGYKLPDRLGNVYASITKGYKSGGYNTQMFSDFLRQQMMNEMGANVQYDVQDAVTYKPETDWNYEIGAHLSMLDAALSLDFAAFWINVNNQQVTMFPEGGITGRMMANAGKARSRGVELSAAYTAPCGWFARGSYGFTDATFVKFNNGRSDFSGKHVPYAPAHTLFLGTGFRHSLPGWINEISAEINTRGTGKIYWNEANTLAQPFYMLLNASVTARHNNVALEIWANNITNTRYNSFYFESNNNTFLQQGNRLLIGATVKFDVEL